MKAEVLKVEYEGSVETVQSQGEAHSLFRAFLFYKWETVEFKNASMKLKNTRIDNLIRQKLNRWGLAEENRTMVYSHQIISELRRILGLSAEETSVNREGTLAPKGENV